MISRNNYESYLVDYLDGSLTPQVKAEVEAFLLLNPDLAIEFDGLEQVSLSAPKVTFKAKNSLKKSYYNELGVETELDYLCIAELENDINSFEAKKLEQLTSTKTEAQQIRTVYAKTKLVPDSSITFESKKQIKRYTINPFKLTVYRVVGAAAVLALTWGVYRWNISNSDIVAVGSEVVAEVSETQKVVDLNEAIEKVEVKSEPVLVAQVETQNSPKSQLRDVIQEVVAAENENRLFEEELAPRKLTPINPISSRVDVIPVDNRLLQSIQKNRDLEQVVVPVEKQALYAQQYESRTKEYSLKDIAVAGAMKIGEYLGIKSDVKYNDNGKVTRVKVESSLIAFSSTYKRNELTE